MSGEFRRFVTVRLRWLISEPPSIATAGLTAYRDQIGPEDLFSVFVRFCDPSENGSWRSARIWALVEQMEPRLPLVGDTLILTSGSKLVAEALIASEGSELREPVEH